MHNGLSFWCCTNDSVKTIVSFQPNTVSLTILRFLKDAEELAFDLGLGKNASPEDLHSALVTAAEQLSHAQEATWISCDILNCLGTVLASVFRNNLKFLKCFNKPQVFEKNLAFNPLLGR